MLKFSIKMFNTSLHVLLVQIYMGITSTLNTINICNFLVSIYAVFIFSDNYVVFLVSSNNVEGLLLVSNNNYAVFLVSIENYVAFLIFYDTYVAFLEFKENLFQTVQQIYVHARK